MFLLKDVGVFDEHIDSKPTLQAGPLSGQGIDSVAPTVNGKFTAMWRSSGRLRRAMGPRLREGDVGKL
jgi:hypothetical protein